MTPGMLVLARRDDRLMLAASAGIYLAARVSSLNLSTWPVEGTWFFNPITWQLIFAIGIVAGRRIKRGGIACDARLFTACIAIVAIAAVVRTDAFGLASGLWQNVHDVLDCGKTDLGFARLVHFLALAYIVYHSGLTGLMRRTRAFATAVPDRPLRFAGFRDRHRPECHGRGRGDARRSFQPPAGVRDHDRRRRHPYALSRCPWPCRVERQIQSPAKHDEPGPHLANGCAIVLAEVCNRLVVRNKPTHQPHLSFPRITSARSRDAVRTNTGV